MLQKMFVYGTLQEAEVQNRILGRVVNSTPDSLVGFEMSTININSNTYYIIVKKEGSNNEIKGMVLDIEEKDLPALDEYETKAYRREKVILKSKTSAWVYQK